MLTLKELSQHLMAHSRGADEVPMQFALMNPTTGEIRLGALWRTIGRDGWYAEVGNFPDGDYLDPDETVPGLFRHFCDADLSAEDPRDSAEARFAQNLKCAAQGMFG